ncbi:MAG: NAD(P)H-dependent oxidoreductase [Proteobacteria bacterium]|nr:NAD(P)H-dependent oxidoreductase [Pseudomonadota bacterium]
MSSFIPSVSFVVISSSLSPTSKSAILAQQAVTFLKNEENYVDFIDLRTFSLPLCNGLNNSSYDHPSVKEIHDRILKADGIILASPIHNFAIAASCKNLLELTNTPYRDKLSGKAWSEKVVGFIGQSGSPRSLLAPLSFFGSLMFDARTTIVPHFVMSSAEDFEGDIPSPSILNRVQKLTQETRRYTQALKS